MDPSTFLHHLANASLLDEISNSEDGDAIARYVRNQAKASSSEGNTTKDILFVIYQTGRHGPQNGFRLALVKEGVRVGEAVERLKGEVGQGVEECVVVESEDEAPAG
ncbi:MAG: hypothetical protein Q9220_006097 [cf. Caloplaca sp. 1 TL-2023]